MSMKHATNAVLVTLSLPLLMASDCNGEGYKPDTAAGASTTLNDTASGGGGGGAVPTGPCVSTPGGSVLFWYDTIDGVCFRGDYTDSSQPIPPNAFLTVPFGSDPANWYNLTETDSGEDSSDQEFTILFGATGVPLVYDHSNDGIFWAWQHDDVCDLWPNKTIDWWFTDGMNAGWAYGYTDYDICNHPNLPQPLPPPVPDSSGNVLSGGQTCTPGTASFEVAWRGMRGADPTAASGPVSLLTTDAGVSVPERAWVTKIEVTDWGTADNFHVVDVDDDEYVLWSGNALQSKSQPIHKPATGTSITTWPVGKVTLGNALAVVGHDTTDPAASLPKVDVTWSCDVDPVNPHYETPGNYAGYATQLPGMAHIKSRMVFWLPTAGGDLLVAPEGRFRDHMRSSLTPHPSGGKQFTIHLKHFQDAQLTGRVVLLSGGGFALRDLVATHDGTAYPLADRMLSSL